MKRKLSLIYFISLIFFNISLSAQNVGIGNTTPVFPLHISSNSDSALLIENINTLAAGVKSGGVYFGNNVINNPVGYRYTGAIKTIGTNNTDARLGIFTSAGATPASLVERLTILDGGYVGIGNIDPLYKLDVAGNIHGNFNAYFDGAVGIGTVSPGYKLQVNNGAIALYNTTDLKTWYMNYSSSSNYFSILEDGTNRLVIANGGNVGIGTSTPTAKLEVAGDVAISGNLTVNAGKGILRSYNGTQFKYYTREAAFGAVLGGFDLSGEGSFGFASAGFTSPPAVMVGDIVSTGGTVGELYRVQLVVYGCTTTSCKCRLLNTSPNSVNYNVTYNIVCIGE